METELMLLHLVCIFELIGTAISSAEVGSLREQVEFIDHHLKSNGPSISILQKYDDIIIELRNQDEQNAETSGLLNSIYLKKGLINEALNRDRVAIEDFKSCIGVGSSTFNEECFQRYVDMLLMYGKMSELADYLKSMAEYIPQKNLTSIETRITEIQQLEAMIQSARRGNRIQNCLNSARELILVSRHNPIARRNEISCLRDIVAPSSILSYHEKVLRLTDDYQDIVMSEADPKPNDFMALSELYMFGEETSMVTGHKVIKRCLRRNIDSMQCRCLSDIFSQLMDTFRIIDKVSKYYKWMYNADPKEMEVSTLEDLEPTSYEWSVLKSSLFNLKQKSSFKIRKNHIFGNIDATSENNFELLIKIMLQEYKKNFNLSEHDVLSSSNFVRNMLVMAKEALLQVGSHEDVKQLFSSVFYKRYIMDETRGEDIPDIAMHIDELLYQKKYRDLARLFNEMNYKYKSSSLIKDRYRQFLRIKRRQETERAEYIKRRKIKKNQDRENYFKSRRRNNGRRRQQKQEQGVPPQNGNKNYYKILGVNRNADDATIKKAYREKMRQNHPDKLRRTSSLTDEQIESNVADINNAYETLSDPNKRKQYDQLIHGQNNHNFGRGHGYPQQGSGKMGNGRSHVIYSGGPNPNHRFMKFAGGNSQFDNEMNNFGFGSFGKMFKQGMRAGQKGLFRSKSKRTRKSYNKAHNGFQMNWRNGRDFRRNF